MFSENDIQAVIHFAGLKAVGESVSKPLEYYDNNVNGSLVLARSMKKAGVKSIVFSSSATVYGRVNLIGEHTDYNDGFVLPCAINYQTVVAAAKRDDNIVRVVSVDYGNAVDEFDLTQEITFQQDKMWANYIRGADISVTGNVPQGAGLSSSAALEVVIGQTFKVLYNLEISQAEVALNGQQAENEFVGCNCGIMDQMISAEGRANHAMLLDCRSLETQAVSMPEDMAVVIINSNKKRGLVDSEYNTRREQCEEAARIFGVPALRDVTIEQFKAKESELDEMVAKRSLYAVIAIVAWVIMFQN
eukprot:snap_masked-scaffold839_size90343-processed-gene-0.1 protein:Tk10894 transcript:snap_masked-scaffold839_size90343-processed-gene-0.1-mRNA-1 annotation:"galactokinase"